MKKTLKHIFLITTIFVFNIVLCFSSSKIDSLESLLKIAVGNHKADIYRYLVIEYQYISPTKAISLATDGMNIAIQNDYREGQAWLLNEMGVCYIKIGKYDKALDNYIQANNLFEGSGNQLGISYTLCNIGNLERLRKNYNVALDYHKKALEIKLKLNDSLQIAYSYDKIGLIYEDSGNFELALTNYKNAFNIYNNLQNQQGISTTTKNIGSIYLKLKKYDISLDYLQKSIDIAKSLDNHAGIASRLILIGNVYFEMNDFVNSEKYLKDGLTIALELNLTELLKEVNLSLSNLYLAKSDFKNAYYYLNEHHKIANSMFYDETNQKYLQLQSEFQNEKKENEIKYLKEVQKSYVLILIAGSSLILILFIGLYSRFKSKKKTNIVLEEKNAEIIKTNSELMLKNNQIYEQNEELEQQQIELHRAMFELSQSEKKFRNIFENNSAIMIIGKRSDLSIVDANSAAVKYWGYSYNELTSMTVNDLNTLESEALANIIGIDKQIKSKYEFKHKMKNGEIRDVESYVTDFLLDGELHFFSIVFDITERNIAINALVHSEEKLKIANETKDKFFSIIAHDLKNPFNFLLNTTERLSKNYFEISDSDKFSNIQNLHKSIKQVFVLLDNLLNWAAAQTGKMPYERTDFDFYDIVHSSFDLFNESSAQKLIQFSSEIKSGSYVFADFNMIDTALRNLVSNAVKFTPKQGEIKIYSKSDDDFLFVTVEDNGVGISKNRIDELLNSGKNTSTTGTSNEKGTGLGLLMVKEFVEKNNGKLFITSQPEKGTKITFSIPLAVNVSDKILNKNNVQFLDLTDFEKVSSLLILQKFEEDFIIRINNLSKTKQISTLMTFSEELNEFSKSHKFESLNKISNKLLKACGDFDFIELENNLKHLENIYLNLKNNVH